MRVVQQILIKIQVLVFASFLGHLVPVSQKAGYTTLKIKQLRFVKNLNVKPFQ